MKNIIGIVLIVAGVAAFVMGLNRRDSVAGQAAEATTSVANAIDGGVRQPNHIIYMVVGGVLVLVGVGFLAKRSGPPLNR